MLKNIENKLFYLKISQKTVLSRFKGPLAVTPSRKERASLLSGEALNQNFRGKK